MTPDPAFRQPAPDGRVPRHGRALRRAFAARRGAVTVDWLVLTAGIVVMIFSLVSALDTEYEEIWDDMFAAVYSQTSLERLAE